MEAVAAPYDYGQRYGLMVIERHLPSVTVAEVVEDDALGVNTFTVMSVGFMSFSQVGLSLCRVIDTGLGHDGYHQGYKREGQEAIYKFHHRCGLIDTH